MVSRLSLVALILSVYVSLSARGEQIVDEEVLGCVADTKFSVDRGFFSEAFQLAITSETEGAVIRYTMDGSVPSLFGGKTYTEPITIDQTTIIRAVAQKSGLAPSNLDTQTYLFLEDIVDQSTDREAPDGWPNRPVNGQEFHYGMNPAVVGRVGREIMKEALLAIPTFSLVTDGRHLFDPDTGIYVNASSRGRSWERPASLEMLPTDDEEGFQSDCGIRIRGGISRNEENPKHSFRVLFRREYGASRLDYPLFGDGGTDVFHNIDLRTSQNWTWAWFGAFPAGARQNTLLRDITSRDTQGALGQPYARSRYHHLYVNGVYWGVYMTDERTEAEYAETYFGGDEEDYDVIKIDPSNNYRNENADGNMDAWQALWDLSRAHEAEPSNELYFEMQGLNLDGTRNPEYPVLLDVDNLIDYLLCIYYTANNDAPVSQWLNNNGSGNNWYGMRNREDPDQGFRFFVHDAENTFGIRGYNFNFSQIITTEDRTGPFGGARRTQFAHSNPQFLHQDLMNNFEYRLRFADRAQKHLFGDGALTESATRARLNRRIAQLEKPILAHAARWGWATPGRSFDERDWRNEIEIILAFIENREAVLLEQLREDELYKGPLPVVNHEGGLVPSDFLFTIQAREPGESVYYSMDGTDPRLPGGFDAAANAILTEHSEITLTESVTIRSRATFISLFDPNPRWGPLLETTFYVDAAYPKTNEIVISEIHYRPSAPSEVEIDAGFENRKDFEFLEITNRSQSRLILAGARIVGGVRFRFPELAEIEPEEHLVLVNDSAAFRFRYGESVPVLGEFQGNLSNNGERLALLDASGASLLEFTYNDRDPWPAEADGEGFSLTFGNESDPASLGDPAQWSASAAIGGSPGSPGMPAISVADVGLRIERDADGLFTLEWKSETGLTYQVQGSTDLDTWTDVDQPVFQGTGSMLDYRITRDLYQNYRLLISR